MKNNLLIQTLEKFDKKELNRLTIYLQSTFINSSDLLVKVFFYLKDGLKKEIKPNKIDLHYSIFGREANYNDHKIRLLLSDLLKLVEQFISQQTAQPIPQQIQLVKFYRKNGLEKHFHRVQRKAIQKLEKQPFRNQAYFAAKNLLEWEQFELNSSKKRDIPINLQELGLNFDIAYFSGKLRQACFLKAQQAFYTIDYDFAWVEQIIAYIIKKEWQNIPAISLYYNAYLLSAQQEGQTSFDNLKQQILEYGALFTPEEIKDIYLLAINFCIKKVNNGERDYAEESLKLYKKGLEIGCFLEKGYLSKFTYANVVAFGIMTADFIWTENFIQNYRNKLQKNHRQSAYAFNMARLLYFQDKNYDAALIFLRKVSDKDLLNTLNAKILQLKIYWETKENNLLESHLEAMANFIRRKEVIGYHKENFLNIISFTKRLLKVNFYDQTEIQKLKKAIEQSTVNSEKKWLLEQVLSYEL